MTDTTTVRAPERGFTLVELMVVVAIIALLATIIVPNYVHARAQAAVSQSEANLNAIATALELYRNQNFHYPIAGQAVTPALFNTANTAGNPYLTSTPKNSSNLEYAYAHTAGTGQANESYTLNDPSIYDATTLTSLPQGNATGSAGGTALCTTCTKINYSPTLGLYGN